jgi:predicted unusual protein kinase regulating ubiquinone biosynthesis (AarF/ABC1/UbiB family)
VFSYSPANPPMRLNCLMRLVDVTEQMRHETDFIREAHNATRAAADIASEPKLRGRVIVPEVYWDRTGTTVMTADWYTRFLDFH